MSTLKVEKIQHPNSASVALTLDTSGYLALQAGSASTPAIQGPSDPNTGIFFPAADTIAFAEGGTEVLRIDSSGRVGIGSSNPQRKLVVSEGGAQGFEFFPGDGGGGNTLNHYNRSTSAFINITTNADQHIWARADGEKARLDSSGRLLIGTSSTATVGDSQYAKFQVRGNTISDTGILSIQRASAASSSGNAIGSIFFTDNSGNDYASITVAADATPGSGDYPGRLVFSTTADGASSPTERMRITSDGYFKASNNSTYSTASPDYHQFNQSAASQWALGVFNRHASQPFGVTIQYLNATPNGTTNSFLLCGDATADRVQLRSNGGIANYSGNNVNLSDINTKKDISLAAGTWDCIKEWEIVNYRYKDQPDDADLNLGVIAQQVAESCPEVITVFQEAKEATETEPAQEERLGIKEQQMYWMAIKALQEAQVRIEALETEVAALKAQ